MPIPKFLNHIQKNKRYSVHTVKAYESDLLQLEIYLHSIYEETPLDANSKMLRSWVVSLIEEGIQSKTINRKISTLKSFYNYLLREGLVRNLPTVKLISPKLEKPLPSYVKKSEMDSLLNEFQFENSFAGRRDALLIELLYSCGIRLSELISIKESDVDFYNSTLKVLGKRNKERIVPLHKLVLGQIRTYQEEKMELSDLPHLLITDSRKKMYPKFVYRKVNYYLRQVTTSSKKSPHVLRHTFATHMLNNGADLNTIKEILGHANLSATEVYTHNTIEKLKNIYNQAHPRA
ncbi:MAG: tyrosine-type recombinase/integrase [Flavobacteriales bacterium]|nr:tyrosine-type recombinase/integrase [Flavobacteriales bacterium]